MKTEELLLKLSKKYPSPQYAFLSQVRNQTGYGQAVGSIRTADALALGLWKSRGYYLHGFELKISRSDWLHEFKDPSKAEAIAEYCDMFSLVIAEESIIDVSEVPKTWGIIVAKNGTVKTMREAPLLTPKPMDRAFLCGFMRNVTEQLERNYVPRVDFEKQIEERVNARLQGAEYQANEKSKKYDQLMENLKKFEDASGLDLTLMHYGWEKPEKIGAAVKMILENKVHYIRRDIKWLKEGAEKLAKSTRDELKRLDEMLGPEATE